MKTELIKKNNGFIVVVYIDFCKFDFIFENKAKGQELITKHYLCGNKAKQIHKRINKLEIKIRKIMKKYKISESNYIRYFC